MLTILLLLLTGTSFAHPYKYSCSFGPSTPGVTKINMGRGNKTAKKLDADKSSVTNIITTELPDCYELDQVNSLSVSVKVNTVLELYGDVTITQLSTGARRVPQAITMCKSRSRTMPCVYDCREETMTTRIAFNSGFSFQFVLNTGNLGLLYADGAAPGAALKVGETRTIAACAKKPKLLELAPPRRKKCEAIRDVDTCKTTGCRWRAMRQKCVSALSVQRFQRSRCRAQNLTAPKEACKAKKSCEAVKGCTAKVWTSKRGVKRVRCYHKM